MKRGPLFRLLRLRRALCPACHRDNIWRSSAEVPLVCRWCGSLMIDFDLIRRVVDQLRTFLAGPFLEVVRKATQEIADFREAFAASVPPPPPTNPLESAIRKRRLPMDGQDPVVHVALYTADEPIPDPFPGMAEVDGSGYARQNPPEETPLAKTYARLVGTVPGPPPRPRWWQWCPSWCVRRTESVRKRWESYLVPCPMTSALDGRSSNVATLAWGGPWPASLELDKAEVVNERGELLMWFTLEENLRRWWLHDSDAIQIRPGGLTISLS